MERAARTCYSSYPSKNINEIAEFLQKLKSNGHLSVFEHISFSLRYITSRSVTHELIRHRIASYSQESQRYVRYHNDLIFIEPVDFDKYTVEAKCDFMSALEDAERWYFSLLELGKLIPQQAREVLPNATATNIVITANIREWWHILKLRTSKKAHPQIRNLMLQTQDILYHIVPELFYDLAGDNIGNS